MTKRSIFVLLSNIIFLSTVCTGCADTNVINVFNQTLDHVLLIENTAPFYFQYLRDDLAVQRRIIRKVDDYPDFCNYFVSAAASHDDYSISVEEDGSFIFHGKNTDENPTYDTFYKGALLAPGTYRFCTGNTEDPEKFYVYLEGWKTDENGNTEKTSLATYDGQVFTIDTSDKYDSYYLGIRVASGYEKESLHLSAQIIPAELSPEENQPSASRESNPADSTMYYNFKTVSVTKDRLPQSAYRDWKTFLTELKYQIKDESVDWYTVLFDDGTGIEFPQGNSSYGIYGVIDPLGRVTSVIGYLSDTGTYMTITDKNGTPLTDETSKNGINGIE